MAGLRGEPFYALWESRSDLIVETLLLFIVSVIGSTAQNILATVRGNRMKPFLYSTIGLLAPIGKRTGVANILGVNFSGFMAWWLWRTIYLLKLPRFEKKVLVALDWTLDVLFSKDLVHFRTTRPPSSPPDAADLKKPP